MQACCHWCKSCWFLALCDLHSYTNSPPASCSLLFQEGDGHVKGSYSAASCVIVEKANICNLPLSLALTFIASVLVVMPGTIRVYCTEPDDIDSWCFGLCIFIVI